MCHGSYVGEDPALVADEPAEFEKSSIEVQGLRKFTNHFRGIYRVYLNKIKQNRKMSNM